MARSRRRHFRSASSTPSAWQRRFRPALEVLEERELPDATPIMVTTNADSGAGSLREAITTANTQTGPTTIDFAIGTGAQTIVLDSALPAITAPVVLDGSSQPGFSGTPLISLTPSSTFKIGASPTNGWLDLRADGCTIKDLVFSGTRTTPIPQSLGILLESNGNQLLGNYIGTDAAGSAGTGGGVNLPSSSNNTIGGTAPAARNVIADGINLLNASITGSGTPSQNNLIEGNYIGIDVTGMKAISGREGTNGITFSSNSANNTIGGSVVGAGNVISGFSNFGMSVFGGGGNLIEGNKIGTNADGTAAVPNGTSVVGGNAGIVLFSSGNTIGEVAAGAGNLISGNIGSGILFGSGNATDIVQGNLIGTDASGTVSLGNSGNGVSLPNKGQVTLTGNVISGNGGIGVFLSNSAADVIQGNKIGTNAGGTAALPNEADGVLLGATSGCTIGGTTTGAGNIISGNGEFGIALVFAGSSADNNLIQGNNIGTDANGGTALANKYDGIYIAGCSGNSISDNVISGNGRFGVFILGQPSSGTTTATSNNVVQGNTIGLSQSGAVLANVDDGVALFDGATNNTIGGTTSATGNVISGNGRFGVYLNGSGTTGNVIEGNSIGTNASNATGLGNTLYGIVLIGAANNTIGGAATGAGNVVGDNGEFGILLTGGANGNLVEGNNVGVGSDGTKLPNTLDGIAVVASSNNTVGGTATGAGNIVDDNARFGVFLTGNASGNFVEGNLIGVNAAGTAAAGNTFDAVALADGASGNTVGGTATGAGNVLSGNGRFGVFLTDSGTTSNVIEGNTIGLNEAAAAALANTFDGVAILSGANGNTVGGMATGAGNTIAANGRFGILLGAASNVVEGNIIGTNSAGATGLGNALDGIGIIGAASNIIGGTVAGAGNVISGNARFGVFVNGGGATNNLLEQNVIGLAPNGTTALPNTFDGIAVFDTASDNTIGGTATNAGNVLSGNDRFGVYFNGADTSANVLEGNLIGVDAAGAVVANTFDGVALLEGASENTLGGTASGAGNTIAGNGRFGVLLGSTNTSGNLVEGNFIGTNAAGATGLGNTGTGVFIETGASSNTVGGTASGAGNTIADNGNSGVVIGGAVADNTTVGDAVLGNVIFGNTGTHALGIDLANDGVTPNGPAGSGRSGPNDLQNHPVFSPATGTISNGNASATISFSSLANSTFRVEFFLNNATDTPAQGRKLLGAITVTTDANGNLATAASASTGVTVGTPSGGMVQVTLALPSGTTTGSLTSTATATTVGSGTGGTVGDTSEFSAPANLVAG